MLSEPTRTTASRMMSAQESQGSAAPVFKKYPLHLRNGYDDVEERALRRLETIRADFDRRFAEQHPSEYRRVAIDHVGFDSNSDSCAGRLRTALVEQLRIGSHRSTIASVLSDHGDEFRGGTRSGYKFNRKTNKGWMRMEEFLDYHATELGITYKKGVEWINVSNQDTDATRGQVDRINVIERLISCPGDGEGTACPVLRDDHGVSDQGVDAFRLHQTDEASIITRHRMPFSPAGLADRAPPSPPEDETSLAVPVQNMCPSACAGDPGADGDHHRGRRRSQCSLATFFSPESLSRRPSYADARSSTDPLPERRVSALSAIATSSMSPNTAAGAIGSPKLLQHVVDSTHRISGHPECNSSSSFPPADASGLGTGSGRVDDPGSIALPQDELTTDSCLGTATVRMEIPRATITTRSGARTQTHLSEYHAERGGLGARARHRLDILTKRILLSANAFADRLETVKQRTKSPRGSQTPICVADQQHLAPTVEEARDALHTALAALDETVAATLPVCSGRLSPAPHEKAARQRAELAATAATGDLVPAVRVLASSGATAEVGTAVRGDEAQISTQYVRADERSKSTAASSSRPDGDLSPPSQVYSGPDGEAVQFGDFISESKVQTGMLGYHASPFHVGAADRDDGAELKSSFYHNLELVSVAALQLGHNLHWASHSCGVHRTADSGKLWRALAEGHALLLELESSLARAAPTTCTQEGIRNVASRGRGDLEIPRHSGNSMGGAGPTSARRSARSSASRDSSNGGHPSSCDAAATIDEPQGIMFTDHTVLNYQMLLRSPAVRLLRLVCHRFGYLKAEARDFVA
ncbi:unnamed protein product [Amoebophrya sp. A120]|nr:unnamed protein product [Amoebophrya sp. A120]|eukprot:GSA120T00023443001.1